MVAIKTYRFDVLNREIMDEAAMLKAVNHKNIVRFRGMELDATGRHFLAMEFCDSGSVQEMIEQNRNGLPSDIFYTATEDLTNALMYLYKAQIIHRDIKPDNLVVHKSEGKMCFKLVDFGQARNLHHGGSYLIPKGTLEYMHPQILAKARRNDLNAYARYKFGYTHELWAIGVTLYEMATGRLPFYPVGGRRNIQGMFDLIWNKPNGIIAKDRNGTPQYILPATSNVGVDGVVRLISGLLNLTDTWTFEHFGREAKLVVASNRQKFVAEKENQGKRPQASEATKSSHRNKNQRQAKRAALAAIGLLCNNYVWKAFLGI